MNVHALDLDAKPKVAPLYRCQFEAAQQAWVLLYPEGMVRLNGPAGEILRRCDGERSVEGLIAELQSAFGGAEVAPRLRADVCHFLADALARGWIR
jgi:pyrroloquinoline quinone biosynthesis protein D